MATKATVKIEGLRELGLALKELDSRVQKRIARSATAAGARVIASEARARVPVNTGNVKKNIRTANLKPIQPGLQESAVGVRVKGKTKESAFYWTFLEFGTAKMPAKPFIRPAFEAKKQEAAERMKEQLQKRIDAEAAKIGQTIGKAR
jgi:HK97 gp10 family phage protein